MFIETILKEFFDDAMQKHVFTELLLPENRMINHYFSKINKINNTLMVANINLIDDSLFIEITDSIVYDLIEYLNLLDEPYKLLDKKSSFRIKSDIIKPKVLTKKGLVSKSKNKVDVKVYLDFSESIITDPNGNFNNNSFSASLSIKPYISTYSVYFSSSKPTEYHLRLKVISAIID